MNLLACVRSGGQTGVDIAALRAAKRVGIPTGGTMPKGWLTLDGPHPEYAELYGMTEHRSSDYGPRTDENVRIADFTLRIAENFLSAGEKRTVRALDRMCKPFVDLRLVRRASGLEVAEVVGSSVTERARVRGIITGYAKVQHSRDDRLLVLNVAGNSERTSPGIERFAEDLLFDLFTALQEVVRP